MSLSNADLERIIRTVWSTQLGLDLSPTDASGLAAPLRGGDTVLVKVYFNGDFSGRLEQRCSRHVSLSAAAAAFAAVGRNVGTSDIRDTATEMAHMTAGNLKSVLPGRCEVSTLEPGAPVEQECVIAVAGFTFEGEPMAVEVIQSFGSPITGR